MMRIPLASLANTGALSRKEGMIKSVEQEKESIRKILQAGLKNGYISQAEMDEALKLTSWPQLQPILDKAQGIHHTTRKELEQARAEKPLHHSDFTKEELEKLRRLAPEEYELLK